MPISKKISKKCYKPEQNGFICGNNRAKIRFRKQFFQRKSVFLWQNFWLMGKTCEQGNFSFEEIFNFFVNQLVGITSLNFFMLERNCALGAGTSSKVHCKKQTLVWVAFTLVYACLRRSCKRSLILIISAQAWVKFHLCALWATQIISEASISFIFAQTGSCLP